MLETVSTIGFKSTYILVDRIDEMPITVAAKETFEFAWPLLANLRILETPGVAFKFFLWDEIESYLSDAGFRTDRLEVDRWHWSQEELGTMLSRRLETYSDQAVTLFNDMFSSEVEVDVQISLSRSANGSPRDMYRLAGRIVAEHTRTSSPKARIAADSVWRESVLSARLVQASW